MNKELIKRYETEFNHWLNGGEVFTKAAVDVGNWIKVTPNWEWNSGIYVIKDKQFEARKAYVLGQPLQYKGLTGEWVDLDHRPLWSVWEYRPKPAMVPSGDADMAAFAEKVRDTLYRLAEGMKVEQIEVSLEPGCTVVRYFEDGERRIITLEGTR